METKSVWANAQELKKTNILLDGRQISNTYYSIHKVTNAFIP